MKRILAFAVVLLVPVATSQAANIWLSTSTTSSAAGEVPSINHAGPGETGQLGVWVQNDPNEVLQNVSLNIVARSPATPGFNNKTAFQSVSVKNPGEVFGPIAVARFEFTKDSDSVKEDPNDPNSTVPDPIEVNPTEIDGFQGFTVNNADVQGVGLTSPLIFDPDPFFDAANNSFLLATIDYVTAGGAGHTDFYLQIGENGLNNDGASSADIGVVFGDLSDAPLNGNDNRGADSATPDASVWVDTPEPSSILLLVIGVIGLVGLRRR